MVRKLRSLALAAATLFTASTASATSFFYIEAYTNSFLGNVHGEALLPSFNGSISDFLQNTQLDLLGSGLGSGYVSSGSSRQITHTFAPNGVTVNSVSGAWLVVSVVDDLDGSLFESEYALVDIDGTTFDAGQATLNLFAGSVDNYIGALGDSFLETISGRGDFKVVFSALKVRFDGTAGGPAIPEPTAALAFAAGLLVVMRRRRA